MRQHDMSFAYVVGVSKRMNDFVFMKGGWFNSENHPNWIKQFIQGFFPPVIGLHRARTIKMMEGDTRLLYEEIRRCGIRTPPRHFVLRRSGHIQKFKPVKNIPIPKNAR